MKRKIREAEESRRLATKIAHQDAKESGPTHERYACETIRGLTHDQHMVMDSEAGDRIAICDSQKHAKFVADAMNRGVKLAEEDERLRAERDELLETCKFAVEALGRQTRFYREDAITGRVLLDIEAAIAKATKNT